jgi:hypothetical protein
VSLKILHLGNAIEENNDKGKDWGRWKEARTERKNKWRE